MRSFISKSTSKISDGIINAFWMILAYSLTTLLYYPIVNYLKRPIALIYILFLLALGGFELQRSFLARISDPQRAWHGMAAGIFFWQVIRFTALLGNLPLFQELGMLYWVTVVLITAVLWRKNLSIGLKSFSLSLLVCWLEKIYQVGTLFMTSWPPVFTVTYSALRYLSILVAIVAIIGIFYRKEDINSRILGAIAIFGTFLFLALSF